MEKYDRYELLKGDGGKLEPLPYVKLPQNPSDKYIFWKRGVSRLDKIAYKYYGSSFYDFLILYSNSDYLSQWDIPNGALIRIPFPLKKAKNDYEKIVNRKINL